MQFPWNRVVTDQAKKPLIMQIYVGAILMGSVALSVDLIKGSIFTIGLWFVVHAIIRLFETK